MSRPAEGVAGSFDKGSGVCARVTRTGRVTGPAFGGVADASATVMVLRRRVTRPAFVHAFRWKQKLDPRRAFIGSKDLDPGSATIATNAVIGPGHDVRPFTHRGF